MTTRSKNTDADCARNCLGFIVRYGDQFSARMAQAEQSVRDGQKELAMRVAAMSVVRAVTDEWADSGKQLSDYINFLSAERMRLHEALVSRADAPQDTQRWETNVALQCRTTASNPLTRTIVVDGGSGRLDELLNDAADAIDALTSQQQAGGSDGN